MTQNLGYRLGVVLILAVASCGRRECGGPSQTDGRASLIDTADPASSRAAKAAPTPSVSASSAGTLHENKLDEGLAVPCLPEIGSARGIDGPAPKLDRRPNVVAMVGEARAGHPRRVRLRFHNPVSSCVCPDFSVTDYDHPTDGISGLAQMIFPKPLVSAHGFSDTIYGSTTFVVTGYFSGRLIDHYEFWREQQGEILPATRDETQVFAWRERHPEFCVESWCAVPDPNPASHPWTVEPQHYPKIVAIMRAAGVLCPPGADSAP